MISAGARHAHKLESRPNLERLGKIAKHITLHYNNNTNFSGKSGKFQKPLNPLSFRASVPLHPNFLCNILPR